MPRGTAPSRSPTRWSMRFIPFTALLSLGLPLRAPPLAFVRDVRPIFEQRCYASHGPEKQKSELRLDVKSVALHGGDNSSPNIIPGRAADSPLIKLVSAPDPEDLMPPKGDALSAAEIST